ncbi:hypothetical protein CYMTET_32220, partial [Cymbomonas tetramitiformis]
QYQGTVDPSLVYVRECSYANAVPECPELDVDAYLRFPGVPAFTASFATANLYLLQSDRKNEFNGGDLVWSVPSIQWSQTAALPEIFLCGFLEGLEEYCTPPTGGDETQTVFATYAGASGAYHTIDVDAALPLWSTGFYGNTGFRIDIPQRVDQGAIFSTSTGTDGGDDSPALLLHQCGRAETNTGPVSNLSAFAPQHQVVCAGSTWSAPHTVVDTNTLDNCEVLSNPSIVPNTQQGTSFSDSEDWATGDTHRHSLTWTAPASAETIPRVYPTTIHPQDGHVAGAPFGMVFHRPPESSSHSRVSLLPGGTRILIRVYGDI